MKQEDARIIHYVVQSHAKLDQTLEVTKGSP